MLRFKHHLNILIILIAALFFLFFNCGGPKQAVKEEKKPSVKKQEEVKQEKVEPLIIKPNMPDFVVTWIRSNYYSPRDLLYFYYLSVRQSSAERGYLSDFVREVSEMSAIPSEKIRLDSLSVEKVNSEVFEKKTFSLLRLPFSFVDSIRIDYFRNSPGDLAGSFLRSAEYFQKKSPSISLKYALKAFHWATVASLPDSLLMPIRGIIRGVEGRIDLSVELVSRNFNRYSFRINAVENPGNNPVLHLPLFLLPMNHFYTTRKELISTDENASSEFWVNILPEVPRRPLTVAVDMFRFIPEATDSTIYFREFRDILPRVELPIELDEPPTLTRNDIAQTPVTTSEEVPDMTSWNEDTVSVDTMSSEKTGAQIIPEDTITVVQQEIPALVVEDTSKPEIIEPEKTDTEQPIARAPEEEKPLPSSPVESPALSPEISHQKSEVLDFKPGYMHILLDDIFFDANRFVEPSKTLNRNYILSLSKVVKLLKNQPDIVIRIEGHTDNSGEEDYNRWISLRRAITVGQLIVELFSQDEQAAIMNRIEVVGRGGANPLIEGNSRLRAILNRRVSIHIDDHFTDGIPLTEAIETVPIQYSPPKTTEKQIAQTIPGNKELPSNKPSIKKVDSEPEKSIITKAKKSSFVEDKSIYQAGYAAYEKKEYKTARTYFESLIKQAPSSSYADNAQYWIGEILYSQKKYPEAIVAFSEVEKYGDKNKVPYAVLRMGYCYWKLGNKEKALDMFTIILEKYPKAKEEKKKAQRMIEILTSG